MMGAAPNDKVLVIPRWFAGTSGHEPTNHGRVLRAALQRYSCPVHHGDGRELLRSLFGPAAARECIYLYDQLCQISAAQPAQWRGRLVNRFGRPLSVAALALELGEANDWLADTVVKLADARVGWLAWYAAGEPLPGAWSPAELAAPAADSSGAAGETSAAHQRRTSGAPAGDAHERCSAPPSCAARRRAGRPLQASSKQTEAIENRYRKQKAGRGAQLAVAEAGAAGTELLAAAPRKGVAPACLPATDPCLDPIGLLLSYEFDPKTALALSVAADNDVRRIYAARCGAEQKQRQGKLRSTVQAYIRSFLEHPDWREPRGFERWLANLRRAEVNA